MEKLTAVVPTLDEEAKIAACLESLRWADELIVVDSHSGDATADIARGIADRVEFHTFENFARQKNWCIDAASHDWVMVVDADERVTPPLREEILGVLEAPRYSGYWIRRENHFLGKQIRGAGWGRDRVLRLFDRRRGRYPDREVHEKLELSGPAGSLKEPLLHFPYESLEEYWKKFHRYAWLSALELSKRGRRGGIASMVFRPPARFMRMYLLQGGFVDGTRGFLLSGLAALQVYTKYARLWELTRENESGAHRHGANVEGRRGSGARSREGFDSKGS
jgi:glycosyltransferase involved in cell wall biosynthesis